MNVNEMTEQQVVDVITNPAWCDPDMSVLDNILSNLEFIKFDEDDSRYDRVVQLAEEQYQP